MKLLPASWVRWAFQKFRHEDLEFEALQAELRRVQARAHLEFTRGKTDGLRVAALPEFRYAVQHAADELTRFWEPELRKASDKLRRSFREEGGSRLEPNLKAVIEMETFKVDTVEFYIPSAHLRLQIARF